MEIKNQKGQNILLFILDGILLYVTFVFSTWLWEDISDRGMPFSWDEIHKYFMIVLVAYIITFFFNSREEILMDLKAWDAFVQRVRFGSLILIAITLLLVAFKVTNFSRGVLFSFIILYILITFLVHQLIRRIILRFFSARHSGTYILMVTSTDRVEDCVRQFLKNASWDQRLVGIALIDADWTGREIEGVPVVAGVASLQDYACRNAVDEAFFHIPYMEKEVLQKMMDDLEEMGIAVHLNINMLDSYTGYNRMITNLAGFNVITFATRFFDWNKLLVKRVTDIVCSLFGLLLLGIMLPFIAIPLKLESPGPLFFSQNRVGKNGRIFKIYKIRSMYVDAEERKKELMAQNEMNGLMFKMTNDPRITKVGKFLRDTSLDEFPQFFNVLTGDMSMVGTRPPTEDEFKQYEYHHKKRLLLKPGITGMWQVSGRSNITDFEEVVRLDLEYINNWSLKLDLQILLKTIGVVIGKVGSH